MKIAETFETIKAKFGVTEKAELARITGVNLRRVGEYMAGKREPTSDDYAKIATAAGISAGELWEAVQIEKKKDSDAARVWENYMKQLGGIAASVLITLIVTVTLLVTPTPSEAAQDKGFQPVTICIMLSVVLVSQLKTVLRRMRQKCPFRVFIPRIAQIAA